MRHGVGVENYHGHELRLPHRENLECGDGSRPSYGRSCVFQAVTPWAAEDKRAFAIYRLNRRFELIPS